jgi:Flp pilus assembly protein TadG
MRKASRAPGTAAVELAIILPILVGLLLFPVFFARCFWHYTVAQKAAQDAVRYLSMVSKPEMRSPKLAPEAATLATRIATTELQELKTGGDPPTVEVYCDSTVCSGTKTGPLPVTVRVLVKLNMLDFFGTFDTGRYGLPINADAKMPYVGQ